MSLSVLYEDNHLLVVDKPAGIATMGAAAGELSVAELAKEYLKHRYDKPGNVYLGIVSRLDLPVTGVLVFARTSKAAGRLAEQFRAGRVAKRYWCLVSKTPTSGEFGTCTDWITKSESQRKMIIAHSKRPPAQLATLDYQTVAEFPRAMLLEVDLKSGRKHQIRLQLSAREAPVLGDEKYGSAASFPHGIALHARSLTLEHPTRKESLTFVARLPESWRKWAIKRGVANFFRHVDPTEPLGDA